MITVNGKKSPYCPTYLEYHGCEKDLMTREEAMAKWRAAAWLRIPVRLWQVGDEGWITMNEQIRSEITKQELTEADNEAIIEELGHIAYVRASNLLERFALNVRHDAGIDGKTPGLVIDEFSVTPMVSKTMRYLLIKWYVQSVEIDDLEEEFTDLNKAIICATQRALSIRLQRIAEKEGYCGYALAGRSFDPPSEWQEADWLGTTLTL